MRIADLNKSVSLEDGVDLIDKSYSGLISLLDFYKTEDDNRIPLRLIGGTPGLKNRQTIKMNKINFSIMQSLEHGIYYPGVERDYLINEVDLINDELVDSGSVFIKNYFDDIQFQWITLTKIKNFDKKIFVNKLNDSNIIANYTANHIMIPINKKDENLVHQMFFSIDNKGKIIPLYSKQSIRDMGCARAIRIINDNVNHYGAGALSLLSDRKYLWLIEAQESINEKITGKMQFGVYSDMVKSLVYARESPLTEIGRKRPILHWVESHKRRLQKGIDIDIDKYLRGITEFEMGKINFKITSPVKKTKNS